MITKTQLVIRSLKPKQVSEKLDVSRATVSRWDTTGAVSDEIYVVPLANLARDEGLEVTVADLQRDFYRAREARDAGKAKAED